MRRLVREKLELFISERPDVVGKLVVALPKLGQRE
jgi:hypothetical protein